MKKLLLLLILFSNCAFANDWIIGVWHFHPEETSKMYRLSGALDAKSKKFIGFMGASTINITHDRLTTKLDANGPARPTVVGNISVSNSRAEVTVQSLIGADKIRVFDKMSENMIKEVTKDSNDIVAIYTRQPN